jgi:hypothetical protein
MNKKLNILAITFLLSMTVGCSNSNKHGNDCKCSSCSMAITNEEKRLENETFLELIHRRNGFYEYKDIETGVHYLLFSNTCGSAITPMYNSDGTLKVD